MYNHLITSVKQALNTPGRITKYVLILFTMIILYPVSGWSVVIALNPTQDTYVNESSPTSSYGSNQTLAAQFRTLDAREALFQFDLSGIPQGAQIISASLELYNKSSTNFVAGDAGVYTILSTWSCTTTSCTTTWNTKPSRAQSFEDSINISSTNVYFEWDVRQLVQDWVDRFEVNYGVMVRSEGSGRLFFSSSETLNPPILRIEFNTLPPSPSPSPSPTPSPTPPSSTNPWKDTTGRTFDIVCVANANDPATDIQKLAKSGVCHGFMDAWGNGSGNLIKGTMGNTADWVIPYFDFGNNKEVGGSDQDENWFDNVVKRERPEWILKERTASGCNGRWIVLDEDPNRVDKISYAMDYGSYGLGSALDESKYVDRWAKELLDTYQRNNWDGVWADNVHNYNNQIRRFCYANRDAQGKLISRVNCGAIKVCNPRTRQNYTENEYNLDLLNALNRLRRLFDPPGLFFMANGSGSWWKQYLVEGLNPSMADLFDAVYVSQIEDFALRFEGGAQRYLAWRDQLNIVQDIYRNHRATIVFRTASGQGTSPDLKFFRDASWLLVKEFNMMQRTFTVVGLVQLDPWWTTTNLGEPVGEMFIVNGTNEHVRRRNYRGKAPEGTGIVIANGGDNNTYTVQLSKSCIDTQKQANQGGAPRVTSVTLRPHSGFIGKDCR